MFHSVFECFFMKRTPSGFPRIKSVRVPLQGHRDTHVRTGRLLWVIQITSQLYPVYGIWRCLCELSCLVSSCICLLLFEWTWSSHPSYSFHNRANVLTCLNLQRSQHKTPKTYHFYSAKYTANRYLMTVILDFLSILLGNIAVGISTLTHG